MGERHGHHTPSSGQVDCRLRLEHGEGLSCDDAMFGILHSRFHEASSLRLGTWLGKGNDPRYTPTTTFETFPFPGGQWPDVPAATYAADPCAIAIADAARRLAGYPGRPVPRHEAAAKPCVGGWPVVH